MFQTWKSGAVALSAVLAVAGVVLSGAAVQAQTAPAGAPTFTKDVAPILQKSCQTCHRPGMMAPMSLLTYQDARPWARSMKAKVSNREMPPWFIDRNIGIHQFKDDPSLTDAEITTIATWADNGAPEGNPADMPPPRHFEDSNQWHIGRPDHIIEAPVALTIKPRSTDWWGNLVADSGLTEDRYIRAIETKPSPGGGVRVLHHAVNSLLDEDGGIESGTLNEYAVGKNGDIYPEGSGKLIKAGQRVQFNVHYHAVGEEITDRASIGLVFSS